MSQKKSFRILAAAVIIGFSATTAAPAVMAAPISAQAEALPPGVSIGRTITTNIEPGEAPGYGETFASYTVEGLLGELDSTYTLTSSLDTVHHRSNGLYGHFTFEVTLTDQPQEITQLVAKHKDNLVGGDILIELETPLVVPAYKEWPAPQFDDRLTMPEIKVTKDADGFQIFSFDTMNDARTTSDELEVSGPGDRLDIYDAATGDFLSQILPGTPKVCDSSDSIYAGKELSIRSSYRSKIDLTERYGEVKISCDAYIPLALTLTQEKATAKAGDQLKVGIEAEGTYGHEPTVVWTVDGKKVDAEGDTFTAPDDFTTIHATVTAANREGQTIEKFVGWGQPIEKPKPVDPVDPVDPDPVDPDTKPVDPVIPDEKDPVDPDVKPAPKPQPDSKPSVDKDGDKDPVKAECEGLCDGAIDDPKPVKPADKMGPVIEDWFKPIQPNSSQPGTGIKPRLVKPKAPTSTPGVMDSLSAEALASLS